MVDLVLQWKIPVQRFWITIESTVKPHPEKAVDPPFGATEAFRPLLSRRPGSDRPRRGEESIAPSKIRMTRPEETAVRQFSVSGRSMNHDE